MKKPRQNNRDNTPARLVELETKMAYQEQSLNELSELVYKQQLLLEKLEASLRLLIDKIKSDRQPPASTEIEKPPHY